MTDRQIEAQIRDLRGRAARPGLPEALAAGYRHSLACFERTLDERRRARQA